MANKTNEIDAHTKGRITKLSKKTSDELIQIILRKDNTERKYAEKIKAQASELSRIYSSVEQYKKTCNELNDEIDNLNEIVSDKSTTIINDNDTFHKLSSDIATIQHKYNILKNVSVVLACALLGMIVYIMI